MLELEVMGTGRTVIIGHRGAMGHSPENTLASFQKGLDLGADVVELDIHLSRDGVPVVMHDERVNRTTDGTGLVADMTLAELKGLDAGRWFGREFEGEKIPTLKEVFDWAAGNVELVIEIKGHPKPQEGIEQKMLDLIRDYELVEKTMVISFYHPVVRAVKDLEPKLATGILYGGYLADTVGTARAAGADSVRPNAGQWTPELVREVHEAGLVASTWTVNEVDQYDELVRMGLDSIGTNYPDRFSERVV